MSKKKKQIEEPAAVINQFLLINHEKLDRVLNGSVGREGKLYGGLKAQFPDGNIPNDRILAEYDKLGGLIMKGTSKVKMGSFYDFATRKPKEVPEVVFVFRDIEGDIVELNEGEEIPIEVRAAEAQKQTKKTKKTTKQRLIEDEE